MKPYKIHNTWVDLDHVQSVQDAPEIPFKSFEVYGYITMAFRGEPLGIYLGHAILGQDKKTVPEEAIQEWEAFKTAWMNKDKPNLGECPPNADMP